MPSVIKDPETEAKELQKLLKAVGDKLRSDPIRLEAYRMFKANFLKIKAIDT